MGAQAQAVSAGFLSFGCGGGGWVGKGYAAQGVAFGDKTGWPGSTPAVPLDPSPEPPLPGPSAVPQAVALGTLHWPQCFTEDDQLQASKHLAGLDREKQQILLDEIDWLQQSKAVRSPVALARTLARQMSAGTFVADGAHRVAAARRKAAEDEQRLREAAARATASSRPRGPLAPEDEAARLRAKQWSAAMKRGRVA